MLKNAFWVFYLYIGLASWFEPNEKVLVVDCFGDYLWVSLEFRLVVLENIVCILLYIWTIWGNFLDEKLFLGTHKKAIAITWIMLCYWYASIWVFLVISVDNLFSFPFWAIFLVFNLWLVKLLLLKLLLYSLSLLWYFVIFYVMLQFFLGSLFTASGVCRSNSDCFSMDIFSLSFITLWNNHCLFHRSTSLKMYALCNFFTQYLKTVTRIYFSWSSHLWGALGQGQFSNFFENYMPENSRDNIFVYAIKNLSLCQYFLYQNAWNYLNLWFLTAKLKHDDNNLNQ